MRIDSLQKEIVDLGLKLKQKDELLQKYDAFQIQNDYMSQDGMIKEAI